MKIKSLTIKVIFGLVLFSFLSPSLAIACGVAVKLNLATGQWMYGEDSSELSYINYSQGMENLILTRTFEQSQSGIAWVIPIPANPRTIQIDTLNTVPDLYGTNVKDKARETAVASYATSGLTQIWTFPFYAIYRLMTSFVGSSNNMQVGAPSIGGIQPKYTPGVQVYATVVKGGITSQVITANSAGDLYAYLQEKNLSIPAGSITVLNDYIGNKYSFVASWINPEIVTNREENRKGVFIAFPTDEIFYPLKPGSAYPGTGLPERIKIIGHVSPKIYDKIKQFTTVNYFTTLTPESIPNEVLNSGFFPIPPGDHIDYTEVEINTYPQNLTEDLYIKTNTPISAAISKAVAVNDVIYFIIFLLITSVTAGVTAGWRIYPESRNKKGMGLFAVIGAANCLTLLTVALALKLTLTNRRRKYLSTYTIHFLTIGLLFTIAVIIATSL